MIPHTLPLLYLLFLCAIPGTLATEDDSSSSSALKTWQIALIAGGGAVGLLLSVLGVLMFRRRRKTAPSVIVNHGTAAAIPGPPLQLRSLPDACEPTFTSN